MSTANDQEQAEGASDSKDKLAADLETLKASFSQLRSDLVSLVNSAMGVGKSGAVTARDGAGVAVDGIKGGIDGLKDRLGAIKDKGVNTMQAAGEKLEEHPAATLLIAFGAGFILAKILSRR